MNYKLLRRRTLRGIFVIKQWHRRDKAISLIFNNTLLLFYFIYAATVVELQSNFIVTNILGGCLK